MKEYVVVPDSIHRCLSKYMYSLNSSLHEKNVVEHRPESAGEGVQALVWLQSIEHALQRNF
jgi:hypothetical protein